LPDIKYEIKKIFGFTLLEMVMVLVVIGLLVSIVVPLFGQIRKEAREYSGIETLKSTASALELYARDHGAYPTDGDDLVPDYMNKNICNTGSEGYMFFCMLTAEGYTVLDTPMVGDFCPTWYIQTGGDLTQDPCP